MTAPYEAPIAQIRAAQEQAARHCGFTPTAAQEEVLGDTAEAVLEGAARMAREVLSPLNRVGDAQGSQLSAQGVTTASGFPAAWQRFCADGWPALAAPEEWGGRAAAAALRRHDRNLGRGQPRLCDVPGNRGRRRHRPGSPRRCGPQAAVPAAAGER